MSRVTVPLQLDGMQSRGNQRIVKPHVRAGLRVYPHQHDPAYPDRSTDARAFDWTKNTQGTVMSLRWNKQIGASSGRWEAAIRLRHDSDFSLRRGDLVNGDWAEGSIARNGLVFALFRGVIDTVRLRTASSGGATSRILVLTGRDHGACFEQVIAWQSIWVQTLSEIVQGLFTERVEGRIGGNPSEMFDLLIRATFARGNTRNRSLRILPPALASHAHAETFLDALNIYSGTTRGAYYNQTQLWTQAGQNLHQTLSQWCNPLLNEYVYDQDPTVRDRHSMAATIRERPFINLTDGTDSAWFKLPTTTLPDWLLDTGDMGTSDAERLNLFELHGQYGFGSQGEQAALAPPIWDPLSIQAHGIRPYLESTRFFTDGNKSFGDWAVERRSWQRLLAEWYMPNPYWLSGQLGWGVILPEVRIGQRIAIENGNPDDRITGYVEGVSHDYTWTERGPSSSTQASVTRAYYGSDRQIISRLHAITRDLVDVFSTVDTRPTIADNVA